MELPNLFLITFWINIMHGNTTCNISSTMLNAEGLTIPLPWVMFFPWGQQPQDRFLGGSMRRDVEVCHWMEYFLASNCVWLRCRRRTFEMNYLCYGKSCSGKVPFSPNPHGQEINFNKRRITLPVQHLIQFVGEGTAHATVQGRIRSSSVPCSQVREAKRVPKSICARHAI